jgi:hypothetical protein
MSRFAWLQFRAQAVVIFGGLIVVAVVLAITGPHLVHLYDTTVATCALHGDCLSAPSAFLKNDHGLQILLDALVIVVPCIVGVFVGAPLVARELESGTFRLAWTQSISRTRWVAMKLAIVGLASVAATGLLSLMVTWWSSPLDRANLSLWSSFDQRDLVPIGYAAFAFALGVLLGVVLRRTLPAMAITLVGFVTIRLLFDHFLRPKLLAPTLQHLPMNQQTVQGFGSTNGGSFMLFGGGTNVPNAWVYSSLFEDKAGHPLTSSLLSNACPQLVNGFPPPGGGGAIGISRGAIGISPGGKSAIPVPGGGRSALSNCVDKLAGTYREVVAYQPAHRYWAFQWTELAIYLAAALVLSGACVWWIRRRLS